MPRSSTALVATLVLTLASTLALGAAGPDISVTRLFETRYWGSVDGIAAYSLGTTVCNLGDENVPWQAGNNDHPVIAQNLYRIEDGRFEQIGLSWLKHGFGAIQLDVCGGGCVPGGGDELGVGCADPYTADLNGDQGGFLGIAGLGPRAEVNPSTGEFPFPYRFQGETGDAIYKRLQVKLDDLDPDLHPDARYLVEGHYITPHDAGAGNGNNNAAFREVRVEGDLGLTLLGSTQAGTPAIEAWPRADPLAAVVDVEIPNDGLLKLGTRVEEIQPGLWQYEYALYNMNSHRAVRGFRVPVPAGASLAEVRFHDVDYHSGEPYSGADWESVTGDGWLGWRTDSFQADRFANALRWGTAYNFRFQADRAPVLGEAEILVFRPGTPRTVAVSTLVPGGG